MRRRLGFAILVILAAVGGIVVAQHLSNSVAVDGPVPVVAPNGPNVTLTGQGDVNLTDPWPDANTVDLTTSEGNITLSSSGPTDAALAFDDINGTWTNVTQLGVDGTTLTVNPDDKQEFRVEGTATALSFRSVTVDDGTADFVLAGPANDRSRVTITGLSASTEYTAIDMTTGTAAGQAQSDGSGVVTMSVESTGNPMRLVTGDQTTAPTQSNAAPTGEVSSSPSALSVDINDANFPTDEVQVDISLDGSQVHTENITSNSTVDTTNVGSLDLGPHTWTVNTTDAYGLHTNQTYSFELPQNVTFRNETNASQIVTGVNLTATFYSEDGTTVVERSDSNDDGNISLAGLPNTQFVVVIEADGYYTRRMYLESIFEQQNIYLLNSTAFPNAVQTTFVYEDRTGEFPSEDTTLRIQRAVDPDNDDSFQWATVAGDFWGAAGEFPFTGETNARYRLIIENAEGTQRNLGTHIPVADGTKNVIVGQLEWPIINGTARDLDAEMNPGTNSILVTYADPPENTSEVRIRIWELGNQSNTIFDQNFTSGPYGTLNVNASGLTDNQTAMSWTVNATATTTDGDTVTLQVPVGGNPFDTGIASWLIGSIGWIFLTFVACLYGPRTATLGAWTLLITAGMLSVFQLMYIPSSSLIVTGAVATGATLYKEAMPG